MLNHWLLLTIIAGICAAIFNSLLRRALRGGNDPTAYAWWYELIRAAFFALLIPFFPHLDFTWSHLALLILLGLIEFAAVFVYMKMHGKNELSLSTILMQLRNIYVPIFAFFVLGERLNISQWGGILLVVIGAIIVARPQTLRADRAITYALLAGILTAISSITLKLTSNFASLPILMFAYSLPAVIFLPLFMKNAYSRLRAAKQYVWRDNLPASAINLIAMYALVGALHLGPAGRTTGIFQGISMLAVALGIIFLGEHDHKLEKFVAALITTTGIILLV